MEMKKSMRYSTERLTVEMRDTRYEKGSALILAVVLTSLLAIIGTIFLMSSRIERMATSAISENKELNYAVDSVIAKITQELVSDVPGDIPGVARQEYYDYPGLRDRWLASLEPYEQAGSYYWRQISDVTGYIGRIISGVKGSWDTQDIEITNSPINDRFEAIIEDHKKIELDGDGYLEEQLADADGDGVADSKWVELDDMTSNKGRPIYAAIRIIDNGGMLNVNTARQFDPDAAAVTAAQIDGSSQTQINLFGLAQRGFSNTIEQLDDERYGSEPHNLNYYIRDVVWRYNEPNGLYTPFDLSDELKLRNRYILNYNLMTTRIEEFWSNAYDGGLEVPRTESSKLPDPNYWFWKTNNSSWDVNEYDYRHIGTTYNFDRIIDPNGGVMVNINDANVKSIYDAIIDANLNPQTAAQIAANIVDYQDEDSNVTPFDFDNDDINDVYGFEQPCIYISELTGKIFHDVLQDIYYRSYAVELYKPYAQDNYPELNQWRISIGGYLDSPISIDWSGTKRFHVILFEDPGMPSAQELENEITFDPFDNDPNLPSLPQRPPFSTGSVVFGGGETISLERLVGTDWILVDSTTVPFPSGQWLNEMFGARSIHRDINPHKCIRRLWDSTAKASTLGDDNSYTGSVELIQAHPANRDFTNIGEMGMVFRKDANSIGPGDTETTVRLNLADPAYDNLFQYLTVFDPSADGIDNDGDNAIDAVDLIGPELKVAGRININTAPWFVIAQLPWVSDELAQAIVAYRDKLDLTSTGGPNYSGANGRETGTGITGLREEPGFRSIGELATVINTGLNDYSMRYYTLGPENGVDLAGFPDLTPGDGPDGAVDDFEERDVIFARISNLVTVRSDVFTAYILVRIGRDGPQKRVMAIFDRSNVYPGYGNVRVVALHPVPDPR